MKYEVWIRILYHLDGELRLYGYGREYGKIRKTCKMLEDLGAPVYEFRDICLALGISTAMCVHHKELDE